MDRGLIVFVDLEPTGQMHVEQSNVLGPLKDHPVPSVGRVDKDVMPGVIDMNFNPEQAHVTEVNGELLTVWRPWHFDHCHNTDLDRAGVLRAMTIAPDGRLTLFADGIDLFHSLSPELRGRIEGHNVIYTLNFGYDEMWFGRPSRCACSKPAST